MHQDCIWGRWVTFHAIANQAVLQQQPHSSGLCRASVGRTKRQAPQQSSPTKAAQVQDGAFSLISHPSFELCHRKSLFVHCSAVQFEPAQPSMLAIVLTRLCVTSTPANLLEWHQARVARLPPCLNTYESTCCLHAVALVALTDVGPASIRTPQWQLFGQSGTPKHIHQWRIAHQCVNGNCVGGCSSWPNLWTRQGIHRGAESEL